MTFLVSVCGCVCVIIVCISQVQKVDKVIVRLNRLASSLKLFCPIRSISAKHCSSDQTPFTEKKNLGVQLAVAKYLVIVVFKL